MKYELGVRQWRTATGALQVRVKQGMNLPSLTLARKVVRAVLGPLGRIWKTPEGYAVGLDTQPGRTVLARAGNYHVALFQLMHQEESARAPAEVAADR